MPIDARRGAVASLAAYRETPTDRVYRETNASLWFDRYLSEQQMKNGVVGKDGTTLTRHIADTARLVQSTAYKPFYERWTATLKDAGATLRTAKTEGRIAIGLGDESVIDTAITLHHTYGVPYLPGSALKGLAAHYARNRLNESDWGAKTPAYTTIFGQMEEAGYITFFDALYVPNSSSAPLAPDVLTVHHRDYYGSGAQPPADWDSPNPVSFLTATGSYLLALAGPSKWVSVTFEILSAALKELGIGAKTSSGYGRLTVNAK